MLLRRPGQLTRDYLDGRRKPYVGPIQVFVIINVVIALFAFNTFRTPLVIQEREWPLAATKKAMAAAEIAHRGVGREEFEKEFDRNAGVQGKTWIFAMIPAFALVVAAAYGFKRYFFEHLVFATHFYAFMLIWLPVAGFPAFLLLRTLGASPRVMQSGSALVIEGGFAVYLYLALRRVYGGGRIAAGLRALVRAGLFFPVV